MMRLLAIYLSIILNGCAGLSDKPDGWSCLFFYNDLEPKQSVYVCNWINKPSIQKTFSVSDPQFKNAHCMDLQSFKKYTDYVYRIKSELNSCRYGE